MSEIQIKTTPNDVRFSNTGSVGQMCWSKYNDWVVCLNKHSQDEDSCKKQRQLFRSICPEEWTAKWDEERGNGTFVGVQPGDKTGKGGHQGGHH